MDKDRYWIAVASKDHVTKGISGGFMQVCHGKESPLKRMKQNDWIIYYSPKTRFGDEEKCQSFTAIGRISDNKIYQYQMKEDFIPFRRDVIFYPSEDVLIIPMIEELDFIQNKKSWGYSFRFGFLEISENDFIKIRTKMQKDYEGK